MMRGIFRQGAIGAATASTALAGLVGVAEAQTVKGVIVHRDRNAHSFVVAGRTGHLYAIHATHGPRLGRHVILSAVRLRNATYRLQRTQRVGSATSRVKIRGVVSWVNPQTGEFTISSPGVSLLVVRSRRAAAPALAAMTSAVPALDATPSVGTEVVATGILDDQGEFEDQSIQAVGQNTGGIDLEGIVLAVDNAAGTLTVSADDVDQSGASIVVSVPATFDLSQFTPGEEVELNVQPTGADTATLLGSADDQNAQTANDQGDDQGEISGSDDQGGDAGSQGAGTTAESGSQDNQVSSPQGALH